MDVLLAASRFVSGGLAQDVAAMLGTVALSCACRPTADCRRWRSPGCSSTPGGPTPWSWSAWIPGADDPGRHEAVAVVIERTAATGIAVLDCPDRSYLRSSVSALVLGPADDRAGGRRIRSLVARRDAFGAELAAHAPDDTIASGCTSEDLATALAFIARSSPPSAPRASRFLGAHALACVAGADQTRVRHFVGSQPTP
ncbi:hypothetical protein [Nonomuraea cavernae]|uniref:hypothetical protein n=1 Tax=Nonomuraea cavernae TaxID=2045107 RepID=UPI0033E7E564